MDTSNLNLRGMAGQEWGAHEAHEFGRIDHPYVGDVLPNGATVIAYHHEDGGKGYVLAYVLKGVSGHEYVTWRYHLASPTTDLRDGILCHDGHYFGSLMSAVKDLSRRIGWDD